MTTRQGVLICGHGSRSQKAVDQFEALGRRLRARFGPYTEHGFLEFARPTLSEALDNLRAKGCDDILALPGMLFAAGHAKNDIPALLNDYQKKHALRIRYGRELGLDAKMIYAARDRIESVMKNFSQAERHQTLLLVIGRGASDPDANGNVAKLTRLLWECLGFGWAETAYSGVTFPLTEPGLTHALKLGFKRVVVFPYFLFTGILIDRIYDSVDKISALYKGIEIIKVPYLKDHPLIEEVFAERLAEIDTGQNMMNCQLCKYRTEFPAFEGEKGLPQESHHHSVEGIGTDAILHPHHENAPFSHEAHHHPIYPHHDHPLGSQTLKER